MSTPDKKMPATERLLKLMKEHPVSGPRMLTPSEIKLLKQDQIETREACRKVMLDVIAKRSS